MKIQEALIDTHPGALASGKDQSIDLVHFTKLIMDGASAVGAALVFFLFSVVHVFGKSR